MSLKQKLIEKYVNFTDFLVNRNRARSFRHCKDVNSQKAVLLLHHPVCV